MYGTCMAVALCNFLAPTAGPWHALDTVPVPQAANATDATATPLRSPALWGGMDSNDGGLDNRSLQAPVGGADTEHTVVHRWCQGSIAGPLLLYCVNQACKTCQWCLTHLPVPHELDWRTGLVHLPCRRGPPPGQGTGHAGCSHRPVALFTTWASLRHFLHQCSLPEQSAQRGSSQHRQSPFTSDSW